MASELLGQKNQRIFGMASTFDSDMKPGVEIVRKMVIYLDNLSNDITEDMIQKHLESLRVSTISYFPSKSWMRDDDKDLVTAMRLCAFGEQRKDPRQLSLAERSDSARVEI